MTMGNAANPSAKLLRGEEGSKQLVAVKQEEERGLAAYFESEKGAAVLGEDGMPPRPVNYRTGTNTKYEITESNYSGRLVNAALIHKLHPNSATAIRAEVSFDSIVINSVYSFTRAVRNVSSFTF